MYMYAQCIWVNIKKVYTREVGGNFFKSSQKHFSANTNSVHRGHINKEVLEFIKVKLKGINPAITGNPINMEVVNGRKK